MSTMVDDPDLVRRRRGAADAFHDWGIVPPGRVYARRTIDHEVAALLAEGRDVILNGSRQTGKSSLVARAANGREAAGSLLAWLDLGQVEPYENESAPAWEARLARQLVASVPRGRRDEADASAGTLTGVLGSLEVEAGTPPALVVIDELDLLELHPRLAETLLLQLRAWAQRLPRSGRRRAQFVLVGVKGPSRMLSYAGGGNAVEVGPPEIWLDDLDALDEEVVDTFAAGFGPAAQARELARLALEYAGGYPHAASWACRTMFTSGALDAVLEAGERARVDARDIRRLLRGLVAATKKDTLKFLTTHDNYITKHGAAGADALDAYRRVQAGADVEMDGRVVALAVLRWSGLCRVDGAGYLRTRCELMDDYFDRQWAQMRQRDLAGQFVRRGPARQASDKRVCLITTGGTIGMVESEEGVVAPPENELPFDEVRRVAHVTPLNLFNLDSADVAPAEWAVLAEAINRLWAEEHFDGFVVAHGTDTLAHSASAVAFALGRNLSFPVVFTGSQTTVDIEHGDARSNLVRACLVATQRLPEVVVCFGDQILRGCRTRKKDDQRFDAFESPAVPALGVVAEEVNLLEQNFRPGWESARGDLDIRADFADGILHIAQAPGVHAEFYLPALAQRDELGRPRVRGLIVQSLGAANVPTKSPYDLVPVIREAVAQDIPVVVTSEHPVAQRNLLRYSPAAAAIEAGATPVGNMTSAAVIAKLCWLLPQVEARLAAGTVREGGRHGWVGERMQVDEVGEVSNIEVSTT